VSARCRCGRFSDGGLCVRCDAKEQRILITYPVVFYGGRNEAIGTLRLPKNLRRVDRQREAVSAGGGPNQPTERGGGCCSLLPPSPPPAKRIGTRPVVPFWPRDWKR
jgi:hypothetical protein